VKKATEGMTPEENKEFVDKMTEMTLLLAKELDDIKRQEKELVLVSFDYFSNLLLSQLNNFFLSFFFHFFSF